MCGDLTTKKGICSKFQNVEEGHWQILYRSVHNLGACKKNGTAG